VLNSQTWENILNHILPVAKEELHASFYGNILKNFSRGLKVGVSGKGDFCEVTVAHGLVCRYECIRYFCGTGSSDCGSEFGIRIRIEGQENEVKTTPFSTRYIFSIV
jgi:hypothetical protein